jgi:hypothetical protein
MKLQIIVTSILLTLPGSCHILTWRNNPTFYQMSFEETNMAKRSAGSEDPWPQPNNQQEMKSEKST